MLNPNGRPKIPEDLKDARKMNKFDFELTLLQYLRKTETELKTICDDNRTPALDLIVCKVILEAAAIGDAKRLDFLLTRLIGKPVEKIEHSGLDDDNRTIIILPSNNREEVQE